MCGINAILNSNDLENGNLRLMHEATKGRGTKAIFQEHYDAEVCFNWLQITDNTLDEFPNEYNGTVVYLNGFISNYRELAIKYGIEMETDCDIEFLTKFLNMIPDKEVLTVNDSKLLELNGFFAVLYWCKVLNTWTTFTDRYGIKQLYKYTNTDGVTFISSEVKGILAVCPEIKLDEWGVEDWKCTLGVMNEDTIFKGIMRAYKLPFIVPEKIEISYEDATEKLRMLLYKSFKRNKYKGKAGAYLSGGVDSGIITKWMRPDYCFSVDYVDERFSESDLIKKNSVNAHLSLIINEETAQKYAMETMKALDDPKAGSCYTNFAIAELASNFVTVVYSGAGGDEFFGGYPHRKDKHVLDVIERTEHAKERPLIEAMSWPYKEGLTHFEYDLKFLSAVLVVEDRMSGYHTMETRYPLLDNDLVDFALSLPDEYLENKRILKDVSGLHPDVINGKKKGFSNPYFTNDEWVDFTLKNLKR